MRLVLANGCFDLLHPGHIAHLREARGMGDFLVVALTRDAHVGKPGRPIQLLEERAMMLRELRSVSLVHPCDNAVEAILSWRPTIFVKGADYAENGVLLQELEACLKVGAKIRYTTAPKQSTTALVERIRCAS
jgi:D-beta-D-heptose 7-phosphate kinase/D-beta-D-heptose 1-phosphate adenosyltransferase